MNHAAEIVTPLEYVKCRLVVNKPFAADIPFPATADHEEQRVSLIPRGCGMARLWLEPGFASDGCSGPTIDCINEGANTIACAIHDALYYLARKGHFSDIPDWREHADKILRDTRIKYGGVSWRSRLWYRALRLFGHKDGGKDLKVYTAP